MAVGRVFFDLDGTLVDHEAAAEAMNERSVAVHEEQVLDELIDDLRRNSS